MLGQLSATCAVDDYSIRRGEHKISPQNTVGECENSFRLVFAMARLLLEAEDAAFGFFRE